MSDLISREALMQFPYSPESGTDDMIENWITEAGLCGESVNFDEGIAEKARELCKLVIKGFVNIVETEPSAYDVEAEEQGLLLRLPCRVGDTVYVIPSKVNYDLNILNGRSEDNRVYEQKVHSIEMFNNIRYVVNICEGLRSLLSDFYEETWFLTRAEAEQALADKGV